MSELQNDDAQKSEEVKTEEAVNENPEGSELAAETEATDKTPDVESEDDKKAKANLAYGKVYGKQKQAERERDALQAQLDEAQKKQNVPPQAAGDYPEEFDYDTAEEFKAAQTAYVKNVEANAVYKTQVEAYNVQQENQRIAAQQQKNQKLQEDVSSYTTRAESFGIKPDELQVAGNAVASYGVSNDITMALLADPDGPLLVKHLAANPLDVSNMNNMNPIQAAQFIERELRPKAVRLKPKQSNTPNPSTDVKGDGVDVDANKYPHLKGVTYS